MIDDTHAGSLVPRLCSVSLGMKLLSCLCARSQAQLWFYNLSEEITSRVRHQLNVLGEWQQMRAGLLHHILAQKMGLFQHTHARDIQNGTKV